MILQVTCRECAGVGGYEETRLAGVSWATPHGFPDYIWHKCEVCGGDGTVGYDEYYETEEEAKTWEGMYDEDGEER